MVSDLPVEPAPAPSPEGQIETSVPDLRRIRSTDLLHGEREVLIEHGSEIYRLRLTRNGKLILQK
ncbi:MAG: hemin uptake protein HemP [Planctomycetales bacterium]